MKKSKNLLITLAVLAVLCCGIVSPTFSWLMASSERVVNTFAGGAISIILDEAKVDGNGKKTDEPRVTENSYKFVAGAVFDKDPTVTVLKGSEECYVFLYVENPLPVELFSVNYSDNWIKLGENGNSSLYVYCQTVNALDNDVALEPIFTQISVSNNLTSQNIQELGEQKITVQAYAVQYAEIPQQEAYDLAKSYFAGQFGISDFNILSESINIEGNTPNEIVEDQVPETEINDNSDSIEDTDNGESEGTDTLNVSESEIPDASYNETEETEETDNDAEPIAVQPEDEANDTEPEVNNTNPQEEIPDGDIIE